MYIIFFCLCIFNYFIPEIKIKFKMSDLQKEFDLALAYTKTATQGKEPSN